MIILAVMQSNEHHGHFLSNRMIKHCGIGFRKDFSDDFLTTENLRPAFVELAPENWMKIGGYWKKVLRKVAERYPVTAHGLSLSIGSPEDIDMGFLADVKAFIQEYDIRIYSEHLSYSKCDNAHLYDLLPIPFREDAVRHVAERIRKVQDFLGMRIAIENVSYYTPVAAEMTEAEFINAIVKEADCDLLLDVNNVYVNAFNHGYDARRFIDDLPLNRVTYIHMAGHEQVEPDLIIDTHGEDIINPVYELFDYAAQRVSPVPVLLERDFNIPELSDMQAELQWLENIATKNWNNSHVPSEKHTAATV
jgi:uncharacterized protein (UPF0276 family)